MDQNSQYQSMPQEDDPPSVTSGRPGLVHASSQPDIPMERALLGALLVDIQQAVPLTLDMQLKPSDFYKESHGEIYGAILTLWEQNRKVDIYTVLDELVRRGQDVKVGGLTYLSDLWDHSGVPSNIKEYAQSIVNKSVLRQLLGICAEVSEKCKDPTSDTEETLDLAESRVFGLRDNRENREMVFMPDSLNSVYVKVAALHSSGQSGGISGLPTGYSLLDYLTGGLQASDLIILGGRPGMGKTSLALNLAVNAALPYRRQTRSDMPAYSVAIFSMEMSTEQLIQRLLCQIGNYNLRDIRSGRIPAEQMAAMGEAVARLMKASIYIDDTPALRPLDLRARTRRLLRKLDKSPYPLRLIVVDYLQLMRPNEKHSNLEQSVREISGALKAMAKELNIVVLALSQLRRPENVSKPDLADLRDSGAIEQDADIVAFIVRDELAKPDQQVPEGQAFLTIRKHRNGPTGKVQLYFNKACSSFEPTSIVNLEES
ncbi:MAG: replicative DNA helicase [Deltaproteobacteria bacterium]|jgi:replicative DNA helicase|nr:replicative DNA helicase [Deltaproteobacteria bacterium]